MMSTLVDFSKGSEHPEHNGMVLKDCRFLCLAKGAPNVLLENAVSMIDVDAQGNTIIRPITPQDRENLLKGFSIEFQFICLFILFHSLYLCLF